MIEQKIRNTIRNVPDFPKKGIQFKDITPILKDPILCKEITQNFADQYANVPLDAIVGVESRGLMFGFQLANILQIPFVLVRKSGKLPYKTISYEYTLEYGSAKMEMQVNDIVAGSNVLIHDDLLATGGTAAAACELVKMQGGNIAGFAFLVELNFLNGRQILEKYSPKIVSLVRY